MSNYQEFPRHLEPCLVDRLARSPVVVVTGARQTGKTTLVRGFPGASSRDYRTLDSLTTLDQARRDPEALAASEGPLTVDEVQRVPEILLAVKQEVDRRRRPGRFLLTGSANLLLLKSVGESLAGRASYLVLRPLTGRERLGDAGPSPWMRMLQASTAADALGSLGPARALSWREAALTGGYPPAVLAATADDRALWFEGYVDTYVKRDVRDLTQVGDLGAFVRLLKLASLRTGALLNQSEIGRDAALSRSTAERWLSILETSYLVTLLQPFSESRAKRIIKAPKLYFGDTGLGLHLADVDDEEGLSSLPNPAVWLENLVLNEILAWRETEVKKPGVFYRRTAAGEEVDLVIEKGRRLLPIEVKASAALRTTDAKAIEAFSEEFPVRAPFGIVLHGGKEAFQLTRRSIAVPLGAVL